MNNYSNMSGQNNSMNMRNYKLQEAKRRMATSNNYTPQGMGMTSLTSNTTPNMGSGSYTSNLQNTSMGSQLNTASSYSSVPSINSAMSANYQIERAKQKTNKASSRNNLFY